MTTEKLSIDFYKALKLPKPIICGLVNKITSPRGKRKLNDYDLYEYHLTDTELIQIYDGKPATVDPGLYWIMDIYRSDDGLKWNHYLVVVEEDCFHLIKRFSKAVDSTWLRKAMPYIKSYFEEAELEPIITIRA